MNARFIPSFLLALAFTTLAQAASFTGKVVGVSDGDTIRVMRDGAETKVRLHGVDCPESNQDFGTRAKQFASDACFGKTVTVEIRDTDRYGRTVGDVTLEDGRNLNHELVKSGLAWWYRDYAKGDVTLERLEAEARAAKVGLWSMPNPVAPWEFRRGGSPRTSGTSPPARDTAPAATGATASGTAEVYVTASGTKYHADGCRHLSKSKIPMALEVAAGTYGPCSVCGPPVMDAAATPSTPAVSMPPKRGPPAATQEATPQIAPEVTPQVESAGEDTVYATRTGAKFHAAGCRHLKSSIPMSRGQAQVRGLTACSVCRP